MDGKTVSAGRRGNVVGGPVAEIVARLLACMEDADMLVIVACEQALHFGIGARRIADQHAMLGRDDRADPLNRGDRQFEDVA